MRMKKSTKFIGVREAAELTGLPAQTIRVGLQQNVFPWGYAVKCKSYYVYYINVDKLREIEGVKEDARST